MPRPLDRWADGSAMTERYEYRVSELREKMIGGKMSGDRLEVPGACPQVRTYRRTERVRPSPYSGALTDRFRCASASRASPPLTSKRLK